MPKGKRVHQRDKYISTYKHKIGWTYAYQQIKINTHAKKGT